MSVSTVFFPALIIAALCLEAAVSCPNGFVQHDNSCYKIFHIRGSWSEAKGYCGIFQAKLASIESDREHNFIAGQISRDGAAAFHPGRFWLDATDLLSEGEWVWASDNVQMTGRTYTHWATGQPSNTNNIENCLAIGFGQDFAWDDEDCELKNNFICEINLDDGGSVIG